MSSFRIGIGYDVHALKEGRMLILGGVHIPFPKGLDGHSDADVLVHALCDALLGATALGDIGSRFPDTDDKYKDISSLKLLEKVNIMIRAARYQIGNVDAVIVAEEPKLAAFIPEMRKKIAATLEISITQVSVKATTTEHLGFVGKEEGMAATAVVLLESEPAN